MADNGNGTTSQERWHEREFVANALMSRQELIKAFMDPRRDIDDEVGYPKTAEITVDQYRMLYDREAVAIRVVEVLAKESWQSQPSIYETEDVEEETVFEKAWSELNRTLRGTVSWFQDEEGSPIWEHLLRADIQSGIGGYGILLLGLGDGKDLNKEASKSDKMQLLFMRAFPEDLAKITIYDEDANSPRFGQPTEYSVTFNDPRNSGKAGGISETLVTRKVHWSRVIHLADNLGSSEIFGTSRMQPVYNRLWDLRKLYAGSAEMYWRGAFPGLALETHPQLGGNVSIDREAIRDDMEKYMTGLQRYMALMGMSAKSLAPQVVDPTPQINTQIEAICIRLGVPKRIFMGSERGELSSSQDASTWNARLHDRQVNYVTPRIIVPFMDRLIALGILPEPKGYSVVWPDLDSLTESEKAAIALSKTDTMLKYIGGSVESLMAPVDFLTRILGFELEAAESIVSSVEETEEEEEPLEEEDKSEEKPEAKQKEEGKEEEGETPTESK